VDLGRLYQAIADLASMPSAAEAVALVPEDGAPSLAQLYAALHWLTDFTQTWDDRYQQAEAPAP
jgi:hypothetical protein